MTRRSAAILLLLFVATATGCASHIDTLRDVRTLYQAGDLDGASARIDQAMQRRMAAKERDVLLLDQAMIDLVSNRPAQAEQKLREVRDRFDHLEQKDAGEMVLAMLNDDTSLSYPGEDYEKVLVRAMLAISNLMTDGRDARAYAYQVAMKQDEIVRRAKQKDGKNPKLSYKRVTLGPYLAGLMEEANPLSLGEARRNYTYVTQWSPSFAAGHEDLDRAINGRHSQKGNGVVYVFTLVGRGPYKIEVDEPNTQGGMLIAEFILGALGEHSVTPSLAPVLVPRVVCDPSNIQAVGVAVDGQPVGLTETVTDVSKMAVEQYQAIYPWVIGRAIARRAVKKGTLYGAKEALNVSHPAVEMAIDVGGIVWEATENADTRCWGLLPAKIQVCRIELPVGEHRIALSAVNNAGSNGPVYEQTVRVDEGRNTYVLASFPDSRLIGQIVHRTP